MQRAEQSASARPTGHRRSLFSNCQPANVPVDFGAEKEPFKPGEFVEVSNNSKTDPATWFAKIVEVKKTNCMVEYPFCDGPAELKKMEHIRRARIFDEDKNAWCYVDPAQKWKDGKFSSPMEAKLVSKAELDKWRASVEAKQTQKVAKLVIDDSPTDTLKVA